MLSLYIGAVVGIIYFQYSAEFTPLFTDVINPFALVLITILILFLISKQKYFQFQNQIIKTLLIFCLSFSLAYIFAHNLAHTRLSKLLLIEESGKNFEVELLITDIPVIRENSFRYEAQVITPPKNYPANFPELIRVNEYPKDINNTPPLEVGDIWRVGVRLYPIHGNYGQRVFDYEGWLFEKGYGATGVIRERVSLVGNKTFLINKVRANILKRFENFIKSSSSPNIKIPEVLPVLGLGVQNNLESSKWLILQQSGTIHLFSISGIHITFLAILFAGLTNFFWRRNFYFASSFHLSQYLSAQNAGLIVGLIFAWIYAGISGFNFPAQRTVLMLTIVVITKLIGLKTPWFNTAFLALFIIVIFDPWAVLSEGLWLSFVGVCILLIISENKYFANASNISSFPFTPLNIFSKIKLLFIKFFKFCYYFFAIQVLFAIALLPILIIYFGAVPLGSVFANLIAVPLVSWLIVPLAILIIIFPNLLGILAIEFLQYLQNIFFELMGLIIDYLPALSLPVPTLPVIFLSFLGILYLFLPKGVPNKFLAIIFLLPLIFNSSQRPKFANAEIYVNDVGSGLATLIRTQNHNLLFDTGAKFGNYSAVNFVVMPLLKSLNINTIDHLILSHADNDHAGGFSDLEKNIKINNITVGDNKSSWAHFAEEYKNYSLNFCSENSNKWQWDGVNFELFRANVSSIYDEINSENLELAKSKLTHQNNRSCVLRVFAQNSLLITADIENLAMQLIVADKSKVIKSDYLLLPHHGSNTSFYPKFFELVAPKYVLNSAGFKQKDYPASKQRQSLRNLKPIPDFFHTWYQGTLQFDLNSGNPPIGYRSVKPHYWHNWTSGSVPRL